MAMSGKADEKKTRDTHRALLAASVAQASMHDDITVPGPIQQAARLVSDWVTWAGKTAHGL